jgi:hypothetical protein
MRTAELVSAGALMALAIALMVHATVLPIGWVQGSGPGGGAFPFWLSAGLFVTAAVIFVREFRPAAAEKQRAKVYIDPRAYAQLAVVAGALLITIALMMWLGTYVAIPLFLLFYLKIIGRHGWVLTGLITVLTPVFLFFFFEVTLKILLPKGVTEPLFFPLYATFF